MRMIRDEDKLEKLYQAWLDEHFSISIAVGFPVPTFDQWFRMQEQSLYA